MLCSVYVSMCLVSLGLWIGHLYLRLSAPSRGYWDDVPVQGNVQIMALPLKLIAHMILLVLLESVLRHSDCDV
jgi:hypothetical protein